MTDTGYIAPDYKVIDMNSFVPRSSKRSKRRTNKADGRADRQFLVRFVRRQGSQN